MTLMKAVIPGILFCFFLAIPAYFAGRIFPIIGGPVIGVLLGIIFGMLLNQKESDYPKRNRYSSGILYTAKNLLQYSIILLGFEMNLFQVIQVGSLSLYILLFTLSAGFLTAYSIGKVLKLNGKMTLLIGVGTSICGGSAIAATSSVIQAEDDHIAQAMSTIFLFNIIAVFIFPALGHLLAMSDRGFGIWAGTAINDTSSVVAAATSWSFTARNNTALTLATIVKLTRTLMIIPITFTLAVYTAYTTSKNKKTLQKGFFPFLKVFPWFVIGFMLAAMANTFVGIPLGIAHTFVTIGKFIIIMAMVAIGLNTDLKKLVTNSWKAIVLGLCCWLAVAAISLLMQKILEIW